MGAKEGFIMALAALASGTSGKRCPMQGPVFHPILASRCNRDCTADMKKVGLRSRPEGRYETPNSPPASHGPVERQSMLTNGPSERE